MLVILLIHAVYLLNSIAFFLGFFKDIQQCKEECAILSPSLSNLDGVHIPARLLEDAKGVAVMTVAKGGFGVAGVEFGTGRKLVELVCLYIIVACCFPCLLLNCVVVLVSELLFLFCCDCLVLITRTTTSTKHKQSS